MHCDVCTAWISDSSDAPVCRECWEGMMQQACGFAFDLGMRDTLLGRVGEVLADNGCNCDCEHHPEEHEADCEACVACQIGYEMTGVMRHPMHPRVEIDDEVYCKYCNHRRDEHVVYGERGEIWVAYRCETRGCDCEASWSPRYQGIPEPSTLTENS